MTSLRISLFRVSRLTSQVLGLALLWLAYALVVEALAWVLLHDPLHAVVSDFEDGMHHFVGPAQGVPALCRWDCAWYVSIASGSYPGVSDDAVHNTAFFPLFGLVMRVVAHAFHITPAWASAWISRVSLLGSMMLLFFTGRDFGLKEEERWAAVVALVFSPDGFVLLSGYADGFFLFLSLAAFHLALRDRPFLAAIPAACAGVTRIHAFALLAGLAALGVSRVAKAKDKKRALVAFAPAVACGGALLGLMGYLHHTTHDALAFVHQQPYFGKSAGGPAMAWEALRGTWKSFMPPDSLGHLYWGLQSVAAIVWIAAIAALAYTRSWVALAYAVAAYGMSIASGTHWGAWRYLAEVFPMWFAIARLQRWRGVWTGMLFGGALLQFCFLINFVALRAPGP
jgi:hypothetical protein